VRARAGLGLRTLLMALLVAAPAATRADARERWALVPGSADSRRVILTWAPPTAKIQGIRSGELDVTVDGYGRTAIPGKPALPTSSRLLALPPDASPRLDILELDQTTVDLPAPLARVPAAETLLPGGGRTAERSLALEAVTAFPGPEEPVTMEVLGTVRGVRLVRLVFFPLLEEGPGLRATDYLRVTVSWEQGAYRTEPDSDPLVDGLRSAVANPEDVIPSATPYKEPLAGRHNGGNPTAYLEVDDAAIYTVAYEELTGLGFAATNPEGIRLFRGEEEVPYEWVGDGDEVFEAGEALVFFAEPRFSRWTGTDAYRLVADGEARKSLATRSGDPTGLQTGLMSIRRVVEENEHYTPDCFCGSLPAGRDGDRWTWKRLSSPGTESIAVLFDAEGVDVAQAADVAVWFIGFTEDRRKSPDHRVDVQLNDHSLGRVEWDGKAAITRTWTVDPGILEPTENVMSLTLPGISGVSEGCWLDAFELRYRLAFSVSEGARVFHGDSERRAYTVALTDTSGLHGFDVTDPLDPVRLADLDVLGGEVQLGDPETGCPRRYAVAGGGGLKEPVRIRGEAETWSLSGGSEPLGADVLVVTHPDFAGALDPLVDLRESQGLSVAVANVLGVYDGYGDGRVDPEALRSFVAHAYDTWDPRPSYLLLVGDGSYDPRQYREDSAPTYIPPYLADTDPWAGETAADNRYACVDGEDVLPDLLVGRFPVKTLAEAEAVVTKTVLYETAPDGGLWSGDVVLTADDPDWGGDFPAMAESAAAAWIPPDVRVRRHYCREGSDFGSDCPAPTVDAIHEGLLRHWDEGGLVFGFFGHASWHQWAASRFFHLDDLAAISNLGRTPVVVELTCYTSAFHRPGETLDEALVIHDQGGAVATWGSTGLGLVAHQRPLSEGFFKAVFTDEVETVGAAALAGKLQLLGEPGFEGQTELIDTFTLLGDPTVGFYRDAEISRVRLPVILRGQP